jgi:hypothetical protein
MKHGPVAVIAVATEGDATIAAHATTTIYAPAGPSRGAGAVCPD